VVSQPACTAEPNFPIIRLPQSYSTKRTNRIFSYLIHTTPLRQYPAPFPGNTKKELERGDHLSYRDHLGSTEKVYPHKERSTGSKKGARTQSRPPRLDPPPAGCQPVAGPAVAFLLLLPLITTFFLALPNALVPAQTPSMKAWWSGSGTGSGVRSDKKLART
jgi:hypothetical protein